MKRLMNLLGATREGEEAVRGLELQQMIENGLVILKALLDYLRVEGISTTLDKEDMHDLIVLESFFIDIFSDEFKDLSEEEERALFIIKAYNTLVKEAPEDLDVYLRYGQYDDVERIIIPYKDFIKNARGSNLNLYGQEVTIIDYSIIPKIKYLFIAGYVILRVARRLGFISILKFERPKVLIKREGKPIKPKKSILPPQDIENERGRLRITSELVNNIFYCILRYNQGQNAREKISWLLTAVGLLQANVRAKEKWERIEKIKKIVMDVAGSINWDLFEAYRMGRFELISNKEYEEVLEKLLELEEARNGLIQLMHELGLPSGQFANLRTPELRQKN